MKISLYLMFLFMFSLSLSLIAAVYTDNERGSTRQAHEWPEHPAAGKSHDTAMTSTSASHAWITVDDQYGFVFNNSHQLAASASDQFQQYFQPTIKLDQTHSYSLTPGNMNIELDIFNAQLEEYKKHRNRFDFHLPRPGQYRIEQLVLRSLGIQGDELRAIYIN